MERINGNSPKNARIKIDYSKNKPKVTFSYPSEKHQQSGNMIMPIFATVCILSIPSIITIMIATEHFSETIKFLIGIGTSLTLGLITILIYLPFKKKWQDIYPKYQAWKERKKITIMNKNNIQFKDGKYFCELPVFSNVILDYKATKDFSKYLELLEIREHNFKYYLDSSKIRKLLRERKGKDEVKRRQLNEWMWYARFYFSNEPKDGYIEIIYK